MLLEAFEIPEEHKGLKLIIYIFVEEREEAPQMFLDELSVPGAAERNCVPWDKMLIFGENNRKKLMCYLREAE